jgi:rhamnosyltransferase
MTFSLKTFAITVTFNPDLKILKEQLESLKSQCKVIIVDNASRKNLLEPIENFCDTNEHVKLIALDENIGISRAQNVGIQDVMETLPEARFVLLLDHDSVPNEGMVQGLENEFQTLHETGSNIAAIGPLLYDPRDKKYLGFHIIQNGFWKKIIPAKDSAPVECHSLNSSGSLISLDALKNIGLLEEDFFMDHGETEWCFRAIDKGYKIFGSARVILNHLMGNEVCEYWLFGRRRMPYRSPLRHYYIVRNSLLMQKRSYIPRTWKFWNIIKLFFTYVYFGFAAKESREHRKYIGKGIRDGLRDSAGKIRTHNSI